MSVCVCLCACVRARTRARVYVCALTEQSLCCFKSFLKGLKAGMAAAAGELWCKGGLGNGFLCNIGPSNHSKSPRASTRQGAWVQAGIRILEDPWPALKTLSSSRTAGL